MAHSLLTFAPAVSTTSGWISVEVSVVICDHERMYSNDIYGSKRRPVLLCLAYVTSEGL